VDLARPEDGCTPLYIACDHGHDECVRLLLGAGASVDLAMTDDSATPLYIACGAGQVECVRLLLGAGASVDLATTDDGATPLCIACDHGHDECVWLLLGAGASVDLATTDDGITPLFMACLRGPVEVVQLLSSYGASRRALPPAESMSLQHHVALSEWLVLSQHWTPLHHLEVLSPDRARALLRAGADLHLKPEPNVPSPLERAHELLSAGSGSSSGSSSSTAASLIVRAAGQWSVESHELFVDAERARAATLVRSLYHVYLRRMGNGGWQAVDFVRGVLPFAVVRGMTVDTTVRLY
jgi:hypothetical protein